LLILIFEQRLCGRRLRELRKQHDSPKAQWPESAAAYRRIARKIRAPNFFCSARKTASAPRNAATHVDVSGTGAIGSPPAYSGESIDWRIVAKSGELDRPINSETGLT